MMPRGSLLLLGVLRRFPALSKPTVWGAYPLRHHLGQQHGTSVFLLLCASHPTNNTSFLLRTQNSGQFSPYSCCTMATAARVNKQSVFLSTYMALLSYKHNLHNHIHNLFYIETQRMGSNLFGEHHASILLLSRH